MFLQEIGIVSGVESIGLSIIWNSTSSETYKKVLISNNKVIVLEHDDVNEKAKAGIYQLTSVGKQILALASFGSKDDYLLSIAKDYVRKGYKVKMGDWKPLTATKGHMLNPKIIEA